MKMKLFFLILSAMSFFVSSLIATNTDYAEQESKMHSLKSMEEYEQINNGPFSFTDQFKKIHVLKSEGKKVGLIIGRTVREGVNGWFGHKLPTEDSQTWAYLDLSFSHGDDPHFIMDLTDVQAYRENFPENIFNVIVFDMAVIDFAFEDISGELQENIFKEFIRILEPKGQLSFNSRRQSDSKIAGLGMLVNCDVEKTLVLPIMFQRETNEPSADYTTIDYNKLIQSLRIELMVFQANSVQPKLGHRLRTGAVAFLKNEKPEYFSEFIKSTLEIFGTIAHLPNSQLIPMAEASITNLNNQNPKELNLIKEILNKLNKIDKGNYKTVKDYIVQRLGDIGFRSVYLSKTRPWAQFSMFYGRYFIVTKADENESFEAIEFTEDKIDKEASSEFNQCRLL